MSQMPIMTISDQLNIISRKKNFYSQAALLHTIYPDNGLFQNYIQDQCHHKYMKSNPSADEEKY